MAESPDILQASTEPIEARTAKNRSGIIMMASQELRVYADTGPIEFSAFILEKTTATGALTEKNVGCNSASESFTTIYSTSAGVTAYVKLTIFNGGDSTGAFSFGIAGMPEVEGEGAGA